MVKFVYSLSMACLLFAAVDRLAAQTGPRQSDGTLVATRSYKFPTYDEAVKRTDVKHYASQAEYRTAVNDKRFLFSKLVYMSEGLKVVAYLYRPKAPRTRLPVIIFNRGSFVRGDIAPELIAFFHRLANNGFAVVAPLYRQSDGGEGRDEMGGGDLDDLMNILPLIRSFSFLDQNDLFMYGESRGGIMTYLAVRRKFPLRAAAVFGAITYMQAFLNANSKTFTPAFLSQIWPQYVGNAEAILSDRSALFWANELSVPILIKHGNRDREVDPSQSFQVAQRLQALGKPYQLTIYDGDDHILTKNRVDRDRAAISWFREWESHRR